MEYKGHLGTTLFIGGIVVVGLGLPLGIVATMIMLVIMQLPDQDHNIPVVEHRGFTHSIWFVIIVAVILASTIAYPTRFIQLTAIRNGLLSSWVVHPVDVWLFFGGTVALGLVGHIATDALSVGGGFKVKPLWPVSSRTVALQRCTWDDRAWNAALLAAGAMAFGAAVVHELYYSILPAIVDIL
ncbi:metal-dependent hydrolase [Halostella salina]|uniref:metal-dependent hydrolase n=1 Tax=Halostella salina TaxID=1547897 RepID=UPI000EF84DD6|nr:metal-dependent hydrolase [Halostella salina]